MANGTTAAAIIFTKSLANSLYFTLLAIGATEFKTSHLKRTQSVAQFDDVHQAIQVIRRQNCGIELEMLKNPNKNP